MKRLLFLLLVSMSVSSVQAQYWSDYVLEKGFNARDYFLQPHRIVTLQTKNVDMGLLGIRPDSLSEISYQPARLSFIRGTKLYLDMKGSEDKFTILPNYIYPRYAYDNAYFYPPYMARFAERKLQPMLSVIFVGDIAEKWLPGFKYGFSYELIHHQGPYYEPVPIWYYGAYDAFGMRAEANKDFPELPVNLKRDGLDEKSETAHFMDAYLSFSVGKFLSLGAKVSRTQTAISGDYLRLNNYDDTGSRSHYSSRYLNRKGNEATLSQNEYSAGFIIKPTQNREIGFWTGYIEGNHSQKASETDSSFYAWGDPASQDQFSRSTSNHRNQSNWLHQGKTRFGGIHGNLPMKQGISFKFRFEYLKSDLDLANGDTMIDTSHHHYRYRYYLDNQIYNYIYSSKFSDERTGDGGENREKKEGAVGLVIPLYKNSRLILGLFTEKTTSQTKIYEDTKLTRFRNRETETPYQTPEMTTEFEDKTLRFTKENSMLRVALPV
ncbi:MAG TPA: hypothetical protein ENH29_01155, partial [Bacteroidetes bacterium]|nr:hypothetical protein [Bacteroidota bacterium]